MIKRLVYRIRWWKWLLTGPTIDPTVSKSEQQLRWQKWLDSEPDFNGTYPNRQFLEGWSGHKWRT